MKISIETARLIFPLLIYGTYFLLVMNCDLPIVPPLPLCSSMHLFGSSSSSPREKPLTSFPVQSSNRINEEYVAQMRRIIASSSSSSSEIQEDTKLIELTIDHRKSIVVHQLTSTSPAIST